MDRRTCRYMQCIYDDHLGKISRAALSYFFDIYLLFFLASSSSSSSSPSQPRSPHSYIKHSFLHSPSFESHPSNYFNLDHPPSQLITTFKERTKHKTVLIFPFDDTHPFTPTNTMASPATTNSGSSTHSKHPYKEPKQIEGLKNFRELLGPDSEKFDDGVSEKSSLCMQTLVLIQNEHQE